MVNSPARAAVDVGSVIADTYKIEALLGRGGMGAVFLASHRRLAGRQVAIKILHTEIEDAEIVARFKREAEIAAKLNHPNIVGVIDYNITADGTPYLVLDYLEGETLAQCIARGPVPLDQVLSILRQVGSALAAAHRAGIVHRDLKPQNIFLVPTEVDGRVVEIAKVLDFGISKIRGSQTVKTQDSALLGTPQYMAPEQATGQHASVDERTDVFALGAIVYEMLSGQPAFSGASIPEVVFKVVYEQPPPLAELTPEAPPAIAAAVTQAMAKQASDRFASVTAYVEAITGQPLTLSRGQASGAAGSADSPSAARRVATGEAFARTMGSGDHGDSPLAMIDTAPPGAVPALGRNPSTANARNAAPTAAPAPVAVPAATSVDAPRRRSIGLAAAIVFVGAAAAAGAAYVVMRDRGPDRHERPERVSTVTPADPRPADRNPTTTAPPPPPPPPPIEHAATPPQPIDTRTTDAKGTDAKGSGSEPVTTRPPTRPAQGGHKDHPTPRPGAHDGPPPPVPPSPPPPGDEDDDMRDKLAQANAALARHDYDTAERLASAVINSSSAAPRQRAAARVVHGTVQCVARNDQEAAQIDLRNLAGFRQLRGKLLAACRGRGVRTQ